MNKSLLAIFGLYKSHVLYVNINRDCGLFKYEYANPDGDGKKSRYCYFKIHGSQFSQHYAIVRDADCLSELSARR